MSKPNIRKIGVYNLTYKGARRSDLEKNYQYQVIVAEILTSEGSEVHIFFVADDPNEQFEKAVYDSFLSFAKDWDISDYVPLKKPFLPIKSI